MLVKVVLLTYLTSVGGRLEPRDGKRQPFPGGAAVVKLLEVTSERSCSVTFITDESSAHAPIIVREVREAQQQERPTAMFHVKAHKQNTNLTHRLSQLVPAVRRVRQLSSCMMVVVVSYDLPFLVAFAEWSLRGRLMVGATRLVVVTRLALQTFQDLLPAHWTFSMMNTIFLNTKDVSTRNSYQVMRHLPYTQHGPQVAQVASWMPSRSHVFAESNVLFKDKFANFHGARVNVTALPFAPFWEERKGPDNATLYSGTDYYTLMAIAAALNFTVHVVPTSSWAEVTRLVEERVSFMAPVIHMVMPERREQYDFSFVYEYVSMDFSMAPPGLQAQWKAIYYPLSDTVWVATLLALVFTPFVFFTVLQVTDAMVRPCGGAELALGAVFHDMTGMLLGQNLPSRLPRIFTSRLLVATWLVFAIIFSSAYRGNLTASLTLPKYPPRPETLLQLVDSVQRITMQPFGEDFRNFFSSSESPLFQNLASLIDFVPTLTTGQQQAIKNNQAHLDNRRYQHHNIAKLFTQSDGSELLYIGRDTIMSGQSAWPLPHDAPYTATINRHLMAVVEAGLYEKWALDLLFEVQQESRKRQLQENVQEEKKERILSLSISHMQGAFMLLLLGLSLAALVYGGEFTISHLKRRGWNLFCY